MIGKVGKYSEVDGYQLSDIDVSGTPTAEYYGYLAVDGSWYIQKFVPNTSARYYKGTSGYTTAWTNRASNTYDYFNTIFNV